MKAFNKRIQSKNKWSRLLVRGGKVVLFVLLAYVIYRQVASYEGSQDILLDRLNNGWSITFLGLLLLLMVVNWYLESLRWRLVTKGIQPLTTGQSIKSVLSGVTLALITPARVGEYGGRLLGILPDNRGKAIVANAVSGLALKIVTLSIGLICFIVFTQRYIDVAQLGWISLLVAGIISVMLIFYFRPGLFLKVADYLPQRWYNKLGKHISFLKDYRSGQLRDVFFVSLFRYFIFSIQYAMIVLYLGVTSDITLAITGVGVIFLIQSGIPLPPMLNILARGEIAIWVWSVAQVSPLLILAATFLLWFVNLVIPAIVGAIVISQSDV